MNVARVFTAASACVVIGAAAAACSGSLGSGSSLPGAVGSPNFGGPATPSPTPSSSSSILTYGTETTFQALSEIGGYSAAIAFPKAPEPTAAPASKSAKAVKDASPGPAPTPVAVAIGATLTTVKPQDGPDLNFESGKGRKKKSREKPARALMYITLLPTHDATLASFPRIAVDIPRNIASEYRDGEFGLALWNSGEKDAKYRLAVAELDTTSTPPPAAVLPVPSAAAKPSAPATSTSPSARPSGAPSGGPVTAASGIPAPSAAPTLPPAKLLFAGTATPLKLIANRPAVFAVYALPRPSSTTAPSPKPSASAVKDASKESGSPAPASKASGSSASPAARASGDASSGATSASDKPLPVTSKAP